VADVEIVMSGDAAETMARASDFLRGAPVANNLVLSLLEERAAHPEGGRFWTAAEAGTVVGVAFQSPLSLHAAITPMAPAAVYALVEAMAEEGPDLPGVFGDADTSSRFAGYWAEVRSVPVVPVEGQRLYQLGELVAPSGAAGRRRLADHDDEETIWSWLEGFGQETGGIIPERDSVRRRIADGCLSLWDNGEPVSMASFSPPVAGVSRIYLVYTPPAFRRRGFAAACTAAVSRAALQAGAEHCVLFTQLRNPQSNAIYRRIGYRAVVEQIRYSFAG
jgi:ribosomal protein S18 acetylase RimI-like enzyme